MIPIRPSINENINNPNISSTSSDTVNHCNGLLSSHERFLNQLEGDSSFISVGCSSSNTKPCKASFNSVVASTKKTMYVRTLFDYDPLKDHGLPSRGLRFHHGDILHVVNASDREWWQARRFTVMNVSENNQTNTNNNNKSNSGSLFSEKQLVTVSQSLGIIPSRERIERRHRLRMKRVNFLGRVTVIGMAQAPRSSSGSVDASHNPEVKSYSNSQSPDRNRPKEGQRSMSLTRNLLKCFSYRNTKEDTTCNITVPRTGSLDIVSESPLPTTRSYELVVPITINVPRPLILFGPMKEHIIAELLRDPNYTTCVPFTSRPQTVHEVDGVDFHFVSNKALMEKDIDARLYVEVNRFQGHYYATSLESIRNTLKSGKVCIIDLGFDSVRTLENANLYPITILLKPKSTYVLKSLQRRLTDDQARRGMEMVNQLESENWPTLSAIIEYEDLDHALKSVQQYLEFHNGSTIWIAAAAAHNGARLFSAATNQS